MKVYLPPKAGFLHIRLTDRRTGKAIPRMQITVAPNESPLIVIRFWSADRPRTENPPSGSVNTPGTDPAIAARLP